MYETMNPACIKAVLSQMKEPAFKRHFNHILKQSAENEDLNQQAMYFDLVRFCFFHAKHRFPKMNLFAP